MDDAAQTQPKKAAKETVAQTVEEKIDAVIEAWRHEFMFNSPISRITECFEHVEKSLEPLKAALLKALGE